jgi:hypothetical protein
LAKGPASHGGGTAERVASLPLASLGLPVLRDYPSYRTACARGMNFSGRPSHSGCTPEAADGPEYERLTEAWLRRQRDPAMPADPALKAARLLFQLPVLAGGQVAHRRSFEMDRQAMGERHGSAAQPRRHRFMDAQSPLRQLLEELRTVRVNWRFREERLETMLTIERKGPGR